MVKYRRLKISGGTYFFTVTLRDRQANYLVKHINLLIQAMRCARETRPFKTIALVVLPEHLHTMWQLPDDDDDFSVRWMRIKRLFTESLIKTGEKVNKNYQGEPLVWQNRFWEHALRNEKDYENHVNYIHYNPVKHGLVSRARDWPYSTFHRYVRAKIYPINWCDNGFNGEDIVSGEILIV